MGKLLPGNFGSSDSEDARRSVSEHDTPIEQSDLQAYTGIAVVSLCAVPRENVVDIPAIIESNLAEKDGLETNKTTAKKQMEQETEGLVALMQVLGEPLSPHVGESKAEFESRVASQQQAQRAVFEDIVKLTSGPLYGFVLRSCGYKVDVAEDLTQRVYLRAWRSFHAFRGDSSFKTWLYSIALNETRRTEPHRKFLQNSLVHWPAFSETSDDRPKAPLIQKVQDELEASLVPQNIPDGTTEELYRRVEVAHALQQPVREALMGLTLKERQIVVLHAMELYTHVEIARMLGSKANAVKQRYHIALKKLRVSLSATQTTWDAHE